jgi:DNA polymerase V
MLGLQPKDSLQTFIFDTKDRTKSKHLIEVMDKINFRFGQGSSTLAAAGINKAWRSQCGNRSSRYTSEWSEVRMVGFIQ